MGKKVTKDDKKGRPSLSFDLDSGTGQSQRNLDSSSLNFYLIPPTLNLMIVCSTYYPRLEPF